MELTTRGVIEECLKHKRLAVIGVSRNPKEFSHQLWLVLKAKGYEPVPVNPGTSAIGSDKCYSRVQDISPAVDWALVLTPQAVTDQAVRDCIEAGVNRIWLHRGGGKGALTETAVALCKENGIKVVPGQCPYMFLPESGFPHKVHAFFKKLSGSYPK